MIPAGQDTRFSIVIPVRDEAAGIERCLGALAPLRHAGHEVIVVDGGSRDGTVELAAPLCDRVVVTRPSRGHQLGEGARRADGDALVFLHADTELPPDAPALMTAAFERGYGWGRFDVSLSGRQPLLRLVERMMSLRSRLTGIATGDQGIFVLREVLAAAGGVPDQPLMEDVELSRRLLSGGRPACLRRTVWTSSRRWEEKGILRTIVTMWGLRFAYWLGVPADRLGRFYHAVGTSPRRGHGRRTEDLL